MPTIPLTITIRDYRYSANITVPAGTITPPPIRCPQFAPPLCLDGTLISQSTDPVTGCPRPPICQPKQICEIGEQQTTKCPDGSEIVSANCQKDLVTGLNKWVLTGNVCPIPVEIRIVKILPESEKRLPDANSEETVKISATVICKTADVISRPRDTAYLIIDGAIADRKTIENGIVTFDWEAVAVPISIHNICVKVDPSTNCKSPGQDCKRITVSSTVLGIAEQLAKERSAGAEQRKLLEQARSKLRSEIIGAELIVPGTPTPYTPYIPPTYEPPVIITPPPVTEPEIPKLEYGNIKIIGLPVTLPITPGIPIYIYINDKNIGRLYELPKTVTGVAVGIHSVYARGGDITTPTKTAIVYKDQTTNITL